MKNVLLILSSVLLFVGCATNNNGTVTVVPIAPTNLTGTATSNTQVDLSWSDNSTNEQGFKIERKTGSGTYSVVGSTGVNITTFSDLGLTPNTTYTYRVYAYNNAGNSLQYSNEVTVSTTSVPTLTTTSISSITTSTSTSGGEITDDGGSNVTERGVVWSTSPNPTVSLSTKTSDGTGTGVFTSNLTGLDASTTYYVRAYATNSEGTGYGNEVSFTTSDIDITTGLVAYYPFNGNANDESGNGNNGTVNGATLTTDRFGNNDKAYSFDGISNYINVINPSILNFNNGISFTVSFFYNAGDIVSNSSGFNGIIARQHNNNGPTNGWQIGRDMNNYRLEGPQIGIDGCGTNTLGSVDFNQWVHIVQVYDRVNGIVTTYKNSSLVNQISCTTILSSMSNNYDLKFGVERENNQYSSGKLDDIRIYNRVLTQEQITYLYNH